MSRFPSIFCILGVFASSLLATSSPSAGTVHRYVEDFSTDLYNDAGNTTARWSTNGVGLHRFAPVRVAENDTPGFSRDLFVDGDRVFLADGDAGLQVFDISDPKNPTLVGSLDTSGFASDVYVSGDHAFIADGLSGMIVVDISDPAKPTEVGAYDTPGYSRGVTVDGDRAYVADGEVEGDARLLVVDISDPTLPSLLGSLPVAGLAIGSYIAGDHAYFAGGPGGLHIIDINDPSNPSLVSTFGTPNYARNVVVAAGRAFLATAESGLLVIDVSDPTTPVLLGQRDTPVYAFGVALTGNRVCLADAETGLLIFDIDNSGTPSLASTTDTPEIAIAVAVGGAFAYVAAGQASLQVIQIRESAGLLPVGDPVASAEAVSVAAEGHLAYVLTRDALSLFDVTDPATPAILGSRSVQVDATAELALSGRHVFAAAGGANGIAVFDTSDPTNPILASRFATGGEARGVALSGGYAYVAAGTAGLEIVDIRDPLAMARVSLLPLQGMPRRVALHGPYAFVASDGYGLVVVDIADPAMPAAVAGRPLVGDARDVVISGDYAFLATSTGLSVFDIGDPVAPIAVDSLATSGMTGSVAVSGDAAVLGDRAGSAPALYLIDIGDPSNLALVGTTPASDVRGLRMWGGYACVADGSEGLRIVEVFHGIFDRSRNVAQSLDVHAVSDEIMRSRLSTEQADSITWEITADALTWQAITPDAGWLALDAPGPELRWRSMHRYVGGAQGGNPLCSEIDLEWLYHHASIDSVIDVPDDAGGFVDVFFTRSGHDFAADLAPVTEYVVYRRYASSAADPCNPPVSGWEVVGSVVAARMDEYVVTVPTHADSGGAPGYSVYVVASVGPQTFCSPPDSGYSVDNRVVFVSFDAMRTENAIQLTWDVQGSVSGFHVYRSLAPTGFSRITASPLPSDDTGYVDQTVERGNTYWYRLGVVDQSGNETLSPPTSVAFPIVSFSLFQSHPNPFIMKAATSSTTTITYEIPSSGVVSLQVYDVGGRLVRTLVDETKGPGRWTVDWDGTDSGGRKVVSGVYFYRLAANGFKQTRKMAVIR